VPRTELVVTTPHGDAVVQRLRVRPARGARGSLVLGHGAGGTVEAPDLQAVAAAAHRDGWHVALVTQPYRAAGRRAPAPAAQLDTAWLAVCAALRRGAGPRLVVGGRSSGARVACRTAAAARADAVLALAFPLLAPRRGGEPASRADELDAAGVPVLVVQGERDRFGVPGPGADREVVVVAGDHALRRDPGATAEHVAAWLARLP
jgi:predicted alpha/beta-hydrolase family hydrolase